MGSPSVMSVNQSSFFNFEELYDSKEVLMWMQFVEYLPLHTVTAYVTAIMAGRSMMKSRPGYQLQIPLFLWNAGLAVFSIMGSTAMFPAIKQEILGKGLKGVLCSRDLLITNKICGFWCFLFTLSKFWELGDTFFIVIRKRKLLFLHWYHHVTVLLISWFIFLSSMGIAPVAGLINFGIHSVMYSYYAMQALHVKIPRVVSQFITFLQIFQMVIGASLASYTLYLSDKYADSCDVSSTLLKALLGIYVSYLVLFVKFFYDAYLSSEASKKSVKSTKQQ